MNVYGSMDRQALDAAYNNSGAVADSDQYLDDWRRRSEALRSRMPERLDLIYGDAPRTKLDSTAAPSELGELHCCSVADVRLSPASDRIAAHSADSGLCQLPTSRNLP